MWWGEIPANASQHDATAAPSRPPRGARQAFRAKASGRRQVRPSLEGSQVPKVPDFQKIKEERVCDGVLERRL